MIFFGTKNLLGVDLGSSSIKVAEVRMSGKTPQLINYAQVPTPQLSIRKGRIAEPEGLASAVRLALNQISTRVKKCASGVAGSALIVKKITVAQMDPKLLAEQIQFEAEQYIPFNIQDVQLAHHALGPSGPDVMDVLLIAAQKDVVASSVEVLSLADLSCSTVDVSGFALANCFEANMGSISGATGLLNIGAHFTNLVIMDSGKVIFSRDLPVGGELHTFGIHKELGVTIEDAEAMKLSASYKQEVPSEVLEVINQTNEEVASEIQNAFEFFHSTSSTPPVQRVFITGGCSQMLGLPERLSVQLNCHIDEFNPFQRVTMRLKDRRLAQGGIQSFYPYAAVVLGLAMRQVGDS